MDFYDCKTAEEEHSYLRSERIRHAAVDILDEFTKSWCVDKEETLAKNDLCFRCKKCEFSTKDGYCLVKKFAKDKDPERKDFGAMS